MDTYVGYHDSQSEQTLESRFYTRGTAISYAEFIAYRDACDNERGDAEQLQSDFESANNERDAAVEELEALKVKVWDICVELQKIEVLDDCKTKTGRVNIDQILLNLQSRLEELSK